MAKNCLKSMIFKTEEEEQIERLTVQLVQVDGPSVRVVLGHPYRDSRVGSKFSKCEKG